jgi:CBS domain-containing protein
VLSTSDVLEAASECTSTEERERLFGETLVHEIMTTRPQTCSPDDDVKRAAQEMLYLDVHRLFVEYNGELVGVISQSDIVGAVANSKI